MLCYRPCYCPCFRPYSYFMVRVIVHLSYSLYSIVYMLCNPPCYCPCYRPYSYVIVHVIVHLSYSLYTVADAIRCRSIGKSYKKRDRDTEFGTEMHLCMLNNFLLLFVPQKMPSS